MGKSIRLEHGKSWVRIPPEAAHLKMTALGVLFCLFKSLIRVVMYVPCLSTLQELTNSPGYRELYVYAVPTPLPTRLCICLGQQCRDMTCMCTIAAKNKNCTCTMATLHTHHNYDHSL